jgi:hypothetical protein
MSSEYNNISPSSCGYNPPLDPIFPGALSPYSPNPYHSKDSFTTSNPHFGGIPKQGFKQKFSNLLQRTRRFMKKSDSSSWNPLAIVGFIGAAATSLYFLKRLTSPQDAKQLLASSEKQEKAAVRDKTAKKQKQNPRVIPTDPLLENEEPGQTNTLLENLKAISATQTKYSHLPDNGTPDRKLEQKWDKILVDELVNEHNCPFHLEHPIKKPPLTEEEISGTIPPKVFRDEKAKQSFEDEQATLKRLLKQYESEKETFAKITKSDYEALAEQHNQTLDAQRLSPKDLHQQQLAPFYGAVSQNLNNKIGGVKRLIQAREKALKEAECEKVSAIDMVRKSRAKPKF